MLFLNVMHEILVSVHILTSQFSGDYIGCRRDILNLHSSH